MNFLFLNWRDITHPEAGGAERFLYEIATRLSKKHNITFICSNYPGAKRQEKIQNIEIIRTGGRFTVYFFAMLLYLIKLRKRQYDVVIDDINGIPFFTPLYIRKPIVAIIHHIVGWEIFRTELPTPLAIVAYISERIIPYIYKNVRFIVVSKSTRDELIKRGIKPENIYIVKNGINISPTKYYEKSKTPLIVYIGRIKKYKRIDHIINAFEIVKDEIKDAQLIIAGKGNLHKVLSDVNKRYKFTKRNEKIKINDLKKLGVFYLGEISEENKVKLLSRSWVYVIASIKEGWGISVIEANACGTPAVAYNVPGLRDSIVDGKTGLLVKEHNFKMLAKAIIRLLKDDKLRKSLSDNSLKWASEFNWDKSACEFKKVIIDYLNNVNKK